MGGKVKNEPGHKKRLVRSDLRMMTWSKFILTLLLYQISKFKPNKNIVQIMQKIPRIPDSRKDMISKVSFFLVEAKCPRVSWSQTSFVV